MGIRFSVDNNFFDNYIAYLDADIKEEIKRKVKNKNFSFYPNIQLFSELIGLYNTERKELLKKYSSLFLEMIDYRFFNDWNKIIRIELGIINEKYFLESYMVNNIKSFLKSLSLGKQPDNINIMLDWVKSHKQNGYDFNKRAKSDSLKYFKENAEKADLKKISKLSFCELYNMTVVKQWRKNLIKDIFNKINKYIADSEIDNIIDDTGRRPYLHTYLKLEINLVRFCTYLERKVDKGDNYDLYQLVYLTNLDYFVSNEKRLKELAKDVFENTNKVITFSEFADLAQR